MSAYIIQATDPTGRYAIGAYLWPWSEVPGEVTR